MHQTSIHNASFVTEMCTHGHISVTKWCIVGYGANALWDLYNNSIDATTATHTYRGHRKHDVSNMITFHLISLTADALLTM